MEDKCNNCGNVIGDFKTYNGCCSNDCGILYDKQRNGEWCGDWNDPNNNIER